MTRRPSITAAIIALNEEAKLPGLLRRLDWVDEIVVVDGGSDDATFDIAQRHGCHVVSRKLDSFARQRNFAVQVAGGDWVFSIDADERPTPRLIDEVRSRVARCPQQAFRVPIRSTILRRPLRWSGTQDDCPVRLFRRQSARWVGDVHEVLDVAGRVGCLEHWLEHETLPDLPAFLAKIEHYTTLEARARVAAGRRPAWHAPGWPAAGGVSPADLETGSAGRSGGLGIQPAERVVGVGAGGQASPALARGVPRSPRRETPARIIHVGWVEVGNSWWGSQTATIRQIALPPEQRWTRGRSPTNHGSLLDPPTELTGLAVSAITWPRHPLQRFG